MAGQQRQQTHGWQRLALILTTLVLLAGILLVACGPTLTPPKTSTPSVSEDPAQMLRRVVSEPGNYLGQTITVEGILEAEGKLPRLRFFLRGAAGDRLEVSSWAPLEVVQPPAGGASIKSMSSFVGRRLRLTGVLEKVGGEVILQVSAAQEL